jgi:superfamily II DNA or RNA helicase
MFTRIHLGNGFIKVEPQFPEELLRALTYYQRRFVQDPTTYQRVVQGEHRECYTVGQEIDDNGQPAKYLITMPGFAFRIKQLLEKSGWQYQFVDERTPYPAPDLNRALSGLRDYQLEPAYKAIMSNGGIFACPTGFGKTYLMAAIINAHSYDDLSARNTPLTVVTAKDKEICSQNYEAFKQIMPDRDVGLVMSGKRLFSEDIQVVTLDSLHLIDAESAGKLIVDEVHEAATEKRSEQLSRFVNAYRWGASATPTGRFDGADKLTEGLVGPIIHRTTYQEGVDCGALVPIKVFWVPIGHPDCGLERYLKYKTRKAKYDHGVEANSEQLDTIVKLMRSLPDSMQTLAIMQHTAQMNRLAPRLPGVEYVHAKTDQKSLQKVRQYDLEAIPNKKRKKIYDDVRDGKIRKIMSTYVYKQGVSFPELAVMIQAGGGGSAIAAAQIPGRVSRTADGKQESYVIDFWHSWDTGYDKNGKQKAGPVLADDQSRDRVYKKLGFERVWLDSLDQLPLLTS